MAYICRLFGASKNIFALVKETLIKIKINQILNKEINSQCMDIITETDIEHEILNLGNSALKYSQIFNHNFFDT